MIKGLSRGRSRSRLQVNRNILFALTFSFLVFLGSMLIGRYEIKPVDVLALLTEIVNPSGLDHTRPEVSVLYDIRLPRIFLAMFVGAALSMAGSLFQGIFRNPLVSPDILGVTSGCCFGAALGILFPSEHYYIIPVFSFFFGIIAMIMAYSIARISRGDSVVMLILAGTVTAAFFSAALSFLKYVADPFEQLPAIVFWIMGGFFRASWDYVGTLFLTLLPCAVILLLISWRINVLSLGDEEASSLGINVSTLRFFLIAVATFMIAGCVSVSGTISWVGLVIPHIARLLVGSDHRLSIPMSMILGGGFVLLMDDLARSMTTSEIPISILTSALGAPFFAYLLMKGRKSPWG